MQARVKLGLALLAAVFSGSVVAVKPVPHGQNTNAGPVDVAKTPAPSNPAVPTPYPNTVHGMGVPDSQKEGSKTRVQGEAVLKNKSSFKHSAGDEAGSRAQAAAGKGGAAGPGATGVASAAGEAGALAAPFVPGGAVVSAAVSGSGGAAAGAGAEGSAGGAAAVIPPVAKTPTPGGPVPIPYPNLPLVRPVEAPGLVQTPEVPRYVLTPAWPSKVDAPVPPRPVLSAPVTLPTPAPQPAVRAPQPVLQTQPVLPMRR